MKRLLLLAAVAAALASACGRKVACKDPEEVASNFFVAMKYRATEEAFQLLAGSDRRLLTERARAVSEATGEKVEPHELLVPGLVSYRGDIASAVFKPVKVEVGDVQEVEVTFGDGTTVRTPVVREASCYRIPLGLDEE
jgi:hypothetical protein